MSSKPIITRVAPYDIAKRMKIPFSINIALKLYGLLWLLAIPLLRFNARLRDGFSQRVLHRNIILPKADIWIQAASVGESYLALEIVKQLQPGSPVTVIVTTNTRQGLDVLDKNLLDHDSDKIKISVHTMFFPFDRPALMRKAVRGISPKVLVLLETELWPGLLAACKQYDIKVALVNGRINQKSLESYSLWQSLWRFLRPDITLAISDDDAKRFSLLFGKKYVKRMSNIKFDRLQQKTSGAREVNEIAKIVPENREFVVFGSIREEEEKSIEKNITSLFRKHPDLVIGLFPRHLHRIEHWQSTLSEAEINWILRSQAKDAVGKGTVIIWDTFGELNRAYEIADAVFIGGSLAPLGGQNFLEPLICGIVPIIGPSRFNFAWVGNDVISLGLINEVNDWRELSDTISKDLASRPDRKSIQQKTKAFIESRKGGTRQACETILQLLTNNK